MSTALRIGLLGPAESIHLQRWAHGLASRGHELCVYSQHPCDLGLLPAGTRTVWFPYEGQLGYFGNARALRSELRQWRPDVLNVHYASGYGTTGSFANFQPSVLSVWGSDVYDFPTTSPLHRWLVRRNLKTANAVASTSLAMAKQVKTLVPDLGSIHITPFGVDVDLFKPSTTPRPRAPITIGIVKTLARKYGVDILIKAFAQVVADTNLSAQDVQCRLLIVGKGPEEGSLRSLTSSLGVESLVEFAGPAPHAEVPTWLHRMDIFVAPSRLDSESFGVAVIEAGACGLPVVVSDVGGLPEVVEDGQTGLVVPRENIAELAKAMKRLVLAPELRETMGRRGRQRVVQHYEWGACIDAMERCYHRAIAI